MPADIKSRTTVAKPATPSVSTHLRARPAITPRLAGTHPGSPVSLPGQALRAQTLSPERIDGERFFALGDNITPRSGARVSRLDPESPNTPDALSKGRSKSKAETAASRTIEQRGLGVQSPTPVPVLVTGHRTNVSALTSPARRVSGGSQVSQAQDEARFFRANDARSVLSTTRAQSNKPRPALTSQLTSPHIPSRDTTSGGSVKEDKFFRADDLRVQSTPRPKLLLKASTFSASSAPPSARAHTPNDLVWNPSRSVHSHIGTEVPASAALTPLRSESNLVSDLQSSSTDRRRSSSLSMSRLDLECRNNHRKSSSASSITIGSELNRLEDVNEDDKQKQSASRAQMCASPAPILDAQNSTRDTRNFRLSNLTVAATVVSEAQTEPVTRPVFHRAHTRGLSETGNIRPLSQGELEAATSARRERKVLDLEISNSSLLAINRTLEKELRKQNSELRRFRRLSRSGRLSLTPSNRIISHHSISTLETLDELDHDTPSHETSDGDNSSSSSSSDEDDDQPSSEQNSSTMDSLDLARRRTRDEKKLLRDLARHRQLLIDSQKLTQSIQRCVNNTDEMIREGRGALAYQVGVGEVKIGGRVLRHDDDENENENENEQGDEGMSEVDTSDLTPETRQQHQQTPDPQTQLLNRASSTRALEDASMWFQGLQEKHNGINKNTNKIDTGASCTMTAESLSPVLRPVHGCD